MTHFLTILFLVGAFGFGALLAVPKRRRTIAELQPWIIEEVNQRKRERLRENDQPRVELPLPEPPPEEEEEKPQERVIDL